MEVRCYYYKRCREKDWCGGAKNHDDSSCEPCPIHEDSKCLPVSAYSVCDITGREHRYMSRDKKIICGDCEKNGDSE